MDWTERKLAQREAVRVAEQRRLALNSAQMGSWHFDLASGRIHWDERFKEIFGVADGELSYEHVLKVLHPDDRENVRAAIAAASRPDDPVPYSIEYRVVHPDGSEHWVEAHGRTYYELEGQTRRATYLVGTVRDITEQRGAIAKLAQASEQRRLALDSAQMGWWHYDPATGMIDWDERTRVLYGLPAEHVAYEQFIVTIHPEDLAARDVPFQAALRPDNPHPQYETEYRVRQPDGSWRWVQIKGKATFAGEGPARRAISMDGTTVDITTAKAAQAALLASEARFREVADAMPQIVWTARPDGFIDYYNERWYEYTGMVRERFGDESWASIIHPDDLKSVAEQWSAATAAGRHYEQEFRVRRGSDGEYRWFLGRGVPVKDAHGQVQRWIGTNTDLHDIKVLQEQNEQLLGSERTARSEAERISRVKDEFLATLSHELRTPLNAILGWTQVLRGDPANTEDMEAGLATIERNSRAQTQIIEDLLDMSKIISGKVRLDVQRLDLDQIVAASVETMRPAAAAKGIHLQALIDPQARMISGDPNRLQQVFWNLLSNAIKFTPKGGKVQVVLDRMNFHLEVSVADTGEGISAEFLPLVFDRFRQQDASTTRKHGGLGLGLAIVKQLVELHGGTISVESAGPGQGTTFRVALPLSVVQEPSASPADPERRHPQAGSTSMSIPADSLQLAGLSVLVVDDEVDGRELIKRLLEDRGVEVRTAGSVAQAMDLFLAQRPDVLISDIGMPEADGYALIRQVRALLPEQGGNAPAVALTAYARSEDRLKSVLAGFQMHLAKPVEAAELLAQVASLARWVAVH